MQEDILINWSPQETRVAVVENGAVQELHVERSLERGLVGNVYLGKVVRVLPGMQSAFIDIGLERAAFLHVADVWHRQPDGSYREMFGLKFFILIREKLKLLILESEHVFERFVPLAPGQAFMLPR